MGGHKGTTAVQDNHAQLGAESPLLPKAAPSAPGATQELNAGSAIEAGKRLVRGSDLSPGRITPEVEAVRQLLVEFYSAKDPAMAARLSSPQANSADLDAAIRQFQRGGGLTDDNGDLVAKLKVDGIVGPRTFRALLQATGHAVSYDWNYFFNYIINKDVFGSDGGSLGYAFDALPIIASEGTWKAAFKLTVGMEGGYCNDAGDRGGPTKFGICETYDAANFRAMFGKWEPRAITLEQAEQFYQKHYWEPAGCAKLTDRMACLMFSSAVLDGIGGSRGLLKKAADTIGVPVSQLGNIDAEQENALMSAFQGYRAERKNQAGNIGTFGNGWNNRFIKEAKSLDFPYQGTWNGSEIQVSKPQYTNYSSRYGSAPSDSSDAGLVPYAKDLKHGLVNDPRFAPGIESVGGYEKRHIHGTNKASDHSTGKALDVMVKEPSGRTGKEIALHAVQLAQNGEPIKYVIWDGEIWTRNKGWHTYNPPGGKTSDPTIMHRDHVHISVA